MNNQPLTGVRVIELCNVAAGPFCGMLLADMGADVVKIEHPDGGDTLRSWPPLSDGYSENFASLNRNKRSVALDLKRAGDAARARSLMLGSDIVIESNRPGVMARLGLDYPSLRPHNPKLVYCSISAFGQSGPRAHQGGFDLTIQAMSGIMSVTGEPEGAPVKCGVPVSDFAAGLYAAFTAVALLAQVRAGHDGSQADIPMIGTTLAISALQTSEYFGSGRTPARLGTAHPRNAPYSVFKTRDGYVTIAAGNDKLWQSCCNALDCANLLKEPDFATTSLRARNQEDLKLRLEAALARQSNAEVIELLDKAGVPCSPINSFAEVLEDPQIEHLELVQFLELPNGIVTRTVASPIRLNGMSTAVRAKPPALGEHTAEILRDLAAERGRNDGD